MTYAIQRIAFSILSLFILLLTTFLLSHVMAGDPAIVAAGPIANFLLAILFFWVLAMLGSQQAKPVIGAVQADSLAAAAGLQAGQEILAVDGESTAGWGAVNLQLVRRLDSINANGVWTTQDMNDAGTGGGARCRAPSGVPRGLQGRATYSSAEGHVDGG